MTPLFLQDALVQDMEALFRDFQTAAGRPFQVHAQNLPPRKRDGDRSIYPFLRVLLGDGEDDGGRTLQDVVLVIAVRDPGENMQGHRDVMNAIQRIRERYRRNPEVGGIFTVTPQIRWALPEDGVAFPLFYGAVLLQVELPGIETVSNLT